MTWTQEAIDLAREYAADGLSATEISVLLPIEKSRCAVIGKCNREGIPLKGNNRRPPQVVTERKRAFELPASMEPEGTGALVTFMQLEQHHCRWPFGEGDKLMFCGARKKEGSSYCVKHRKKSVSPVRLPRLR